MISNSSAAALIAGKRVVIVGPAASLQGRGKGEFIDSHDLVVRVNLGCPVPEDQVADLGSRTDILYHVLFGSNHKKNGYEHTVAEAQTWKEAGVQFVATRHLAHHPRVKAILPKLDEVDLPICAMSMPFLNKMRRNILSHKSPNTGILAIQWLIDCGAASVHVIGFDFYASGYYVGYGGFDAERAAMGVGGKGMWGTAPTIPHAQEEQLRYLVELFYKTNTLSFDEGVLDALGLPSSVRTPIWAIVPIKAESERVPGKNTRWCGTAPLLMHALRKLQAAHLIKGILVDTDSEEIAQMVRPFSKVKVVMRPEELRGNEKTANDLLPWEMDQLPDEEHFMFTHVTSPNIESSTYTRAVSAYFSGVGWEHDSAFGVTEHKFRLYDRRVIPINHSPYELSMSQEIEPLYEDNSAFYLFSRESFKAAGGRIGLNPRMLPVSKFEAIDIDTEDDFKMADAILSNRKKVRT
jgi:CMP-N-acetylneuraminic acid synthetase